MIHALFTCTFSRLLILSVFFLNIEVIAEVKVDLSGSGYPQYQCSFCESTDLEKKVSCTPNTVANYCSCKSLTQPDLRILLTEKAAAPIISWAAYEKKQLNNLKKKLVKKKATPAAIKKQLKKLQKNLTAKHQLLKSRCTPPETGDTDDTFSIITGRSSSPRIFILNSPKQSFATDITDSATILGGIYPLIVPTPSNTKDPLQFTGLTREQERFTKIQPVVIKEGNIVPACEDCVPGMIPLGLNDVGKAVGVKLGDSAILPSRALTFDYKTKTISTLPVINGFSASLLAINDIGLGIGIAEPMNGSTRADSFTYTDAGIAMLERSSILSEHLRAYQGIVLNSIKAQFREFQSFNECSDLEIEQTRLSGSGQFLFEPAILVADINKAGDIVGSVISGGVRWNYSSACGDGQFQYIFDNSVFVYSVQRTITIYPTADALDSKNSKLPIFAPTVIGSRGTILGFATEQNNLNLTIGIIDDSRGTQPFKVTRIAGLERYSVAPSAVNDSGTIVGNYFLNDSPRNMRGYIFKNGVFTDLNTYLAEKSDWIIRSAVAINNCGQIAANAVNQKNLTHSLVVLSPLECKFPK
jgi:hypothetical protein